MATAPLVAGFSQLWPSWQLRSTTGGVGPVTFGHGTPMRVVTELFLGGVWVDISPYVLYDDRVRITRGRKDEESRSGPSECRLTLKNQDRRFSMRNTTGPYYGMLRRNTRIRVSLDPGSGRSTRFTGFISEWPPEFRSQNDRFVPIEANGPLRRLGQGESLSSSPEYGSIIARSGTDLFQYWPLEGGSDTGDGANALPNKPTFGAVDFIWADDSDMAGSKALPKVLEATSTGGSYRGLAFTTGGSSTAWTLSMWFKGTTTTVGFFYTRLLFWEGAPSGAASAWEVNIGQSAGGAEIYTAMNGTDRSHAAGTPYDGNWHMVTVTAQQTSANNIACKLYYDGVVGTTTSTANPFTLDSIKTIVLLPDAADFGAIEHWAGHVACFNSALSATTIAALYSAGVGYVGETPETRFLRLAAEDGLTGVVNELVTDTQTMGAQRQDEFLTLLRDCESTAEGLLDETFDAALRLHSRTSRYLPPVALQLDYAQGQLADGFEVTDDDQLIRNKWTITRDGGDSASAMLTGTGGEQYALSITDVGLYDDSATVSLSTDAQAGDHAAWRLRLGTVDEPRWPKLKFALHRDPSLIPGWLACDISSRVQMINPPADVGTYAPIEQIIEGYDEEFDQFLWDVTLNCTPYSGQRAFLLDDPASRYDCGGSTLTSALDATTTSVALTITDNCVWRHDDGDFTVLIEGAYSSEIVTVTAVGAATGTYPLQSQTLTVTRSANGAVQTHLAGITVRLATPARYAL